MFVRNALENYYITNSWNNVICFWKMSNDVIHYAIELMVLHKHYEESHDTWVNGLIIGHYLTFMSVYTL